MLEGPTTARLLLLLIWELRKQLPGPAANQEALIRDPEQLLEISRDLPCHGSCLQDSASLRNKGGHENIKNREGLPASVCVYLYGGPYSLLQKHCSKKRANLLDLTNGN